MRSVVFWKGVQFVAITFGFLAAFALLLQRFGGQPVLGLPYGVVISLAMVPIYLVVAHAFVYSLYRTAKENADLNLKTKFELQGTGAGAAESMPPTRKEQLERINREILHLNNVKKLLAKARMKGEISERDYNSYDDAATKKLIDAQALLKELGKLPAEGG
ncbi:MAG: hypothetical protein WC792_03735 [Candidatus Micrarchaeia archaeon]